MKMETLRDLFVEQLQDLYSAENQLIKALPKMAKAATAPALKDAFEKHLKETQAQAERLETIAKQLGEKPDGKKCKAMEGLVAEGQELIDEKPDPEVLDAGLVAAAQRVEHYKIAGYGTARTYATLLNEPKIADLLQKTLNEEGATDKALTKLAETQLNPAAVN